MCIYMLRTLLQLVPDHAVYGAHTHTNTHTHTHIHTLTLLQLVPDHAVYGAMDADLLAQLLDPSVCVCECVCVREWE
jgi:hypothetical protein